MLRSNTIPPRPVDSELRKGLLVIGRHRHYKEIIPGYYSGLSKNFEVSTVQVRILHPLHALIVQGLMWTRLACYLVERLSCLR